MKSDLQIFQATRMMSSCQLKNEKIAFVFWKVIIIIIIIIFFFFFVNLCEINIPAFRFLAIFIRVTTWSFIHCHINPSGLYSTRDNLRS